MKMKKLLALLLAAAMILSLAACGSTTTTATTSAAQTSSDTAAAASSDGAATSDVPTGLTIAYSAIAGNDLAPWSGKIWDTLDTMCKERGWTFVPQSAQGDVTKQGEQIETMLNSYDIDYFVIFAGDLDAIVDSTKLISDKGIPVIMAALGASDDTYVTTTVGPDQEAMAKQLADDLITANGKDAGLNIVQISGVPVQQDYILREKGFQDEIKAASNYNFLGDVQYAYSSRTDAKSYMENLITTYGDQINVLIGYDDDLTLGAIQAIDEAGLTGKIQVYSITGQKEAMQAIKDGKMTETVLNRGAGIAEGVIGAIEKLATGQTVDKTINTDTYFITKDNVDQYVDQAEF